MTNIKSLIPTQKANLLAALYSRGPSGPFDISYPIIGYLLGKETAAEQNLIEQLLGKTEEEKARIQNAWKQALQEDPNLLNNPQKVMQKALEIDPDFINKAAQLFHGLLYAQQARRAEELTPSEKARMEAQARRDIAEATRAETTLPSLDIARTEEARSRAGLYKQQAITEAFRPELIQAQTGTQKSLAQLYGERAQTESTMRPWKVLETKEGIGKAKAQTQEIYERIPEHRARVEEIKARTEEIKKGKSIPAATYKLLVDEMVAYYWPVAEQNLPEELKLKGQAILTDPMTGKPDEAKMRAYLPVYLQREYDEVKTVAQDLLAKGYSPSSAFREALREVTGKSAPYGEYQGRPKPIFK